MNIIERSSILKFNLTSLDFIEKDDPFDDAVSSVEDVRSGCLYYINQNGDIRAVVNEGCFYNNFNVPSQGKYIDEVMLPIQTGSIGMAEIALDDSGLYYAANDRNRVTRYQDTGRDEYELPTAFTNLQSIEATSPGTQPLPHGILEVTIIISF